MTPPKHPAPAPPGATGAITALRPHRLIWAPSFRAGSPSTTWVSTTATWWASSSSLTKASVKGPNAVTLAKTMLVPRLPAPRLGRLLGRLGGVLACLDCQGGRRAHVARGAVVEAGYSGTILASSVQP